MRLAIVSNVAAPYRVELFEGVQRDISDTTVFFQAIEEPNRSWPKRPELRYAHSYLKGVTLRLGSRKLLFHPGLGQSLRRVGPDVVVAYGFGTATVQCARYVKARKKTLLLANDGTMETDPYRGPEAGYRRRLVSQAAGFIAASCRAAEYFSALGADSERISVVNLTRDLVGTRLRADEVRRASNGNGQHTRERVVCVVARLVSDKRIMDACKAVVALAECVPGVRLVVAGDGPMRVELERWVAEYGRGNIELVGLLSWEDLIRLYAQSDAMIFPARGEKYGMVMIEALACGVPVLAYQNAGAAQELIVHEKSGYLVPDGDWNRFASCLRELFSDGERHQRMSDAARRIVDTHDISVQSRRFVDAVHDAKGRRVSAGGRT
jgi:glycosyltransferase involved in cell wall biosynthesis